MKRLLLALVPIAMCAAWAFWPLRDRPAIPDLAPGERTWEPAAIAALDPAAFRVPLWVTPPNPPRPPTPPPPPPPLKLQLIAILKEGDAFKAALYDPEADALTVVGRGDTIAGRTVERIGAADLDLNDRGLKRTLSLRNDGGTP